jgi:SagB-type dehydrogenase family enzyme
MRAQTSTWGVMYLRQGQLLWDDYLTHRRWPLAAGTERLLRLFATWRPLADVDGLTGDPDLRQRWRRVAAQLVEAEILVCEDSERHLAERRLEPWQEWGRTVPAMHFATRVLRDAPSVPLDVQEGRLDVQLDSGMTPPPAFGSRTDAPRVSLPPASPPRADLVDVLRRRRSRRVFGDRPVPLADLAALLQLAGGAVDAGAPEALSEHQTVFKTSPSGGGRHPTELYPVVRGVKGLAPATYRYDGGEHALERVGPALDGEALVRLCADQWWVAEAQVALFFTSYVPRHRWKYRSDRGYRILLLDVGHLSQTVYLLATALGLPMTFTAATRDELVEEALGIDPAVEFVVGCAVVGTAPGAG